MFIPAASETIVLPTDIYKLLVSYSLSGKIFTIFDTDAAGINAAHLLQGRYNTIPIYFTNNYKSKDPSDMVKDYGYRKVFQHFDNVLKRFIMEIKIETILSILLIMVIRFIFVLWMKKLIRD